MKTRYKHSFEKIVINCDWFRPSWNKIDNGLILGIKKHYFSTTEYEYQFGFFGFLFRVWMKRELKK